MDTRTYPSYPDVTPMTLRLKGVFPNINDMVNRQLDKVGGRVHRIVVSGRMPRNSDLDFSHTKDSMTKSGRKIGSFEVIRGEIANEIESKKHRVYIHQLVDNPDIYNSEKGLRLVIPESAPYTIEDIGNLFTYFVAKRMKEKGIRIVGDEVHFGFKRYGDYDIATDNLPEEYDEKKSGEILFQLRYDESDSLVFTDLTPLDPDFFTDFILVLDKYLDQFSRAHA